MRERRRRRASPRSCGAQPGRDDRRLRTPACPRAGTTPTAATPCWTLQHWVRERRVLSLERAVVAMLTGDQARLLWLTDRGLVRPGLAADLVLFDPDGVGTTGVRFVDDQPGGGRRLVTDAPGVDMSVVTGGAPAALVGALVTAERGRERAGCPDTDRPGAAGSARAPRGTCAPTPGEPTGCASRNGALHEGWTCRIGKARALLTHRESISITAEAWSPPQRPDHLGPFDWSHLYPNDSGPIFVRDAVEHRVVRGGYGVPVPSAAWLRLKVQVIDGTDPCGLSQLLAVADFGSPLESDKLHWSRLGSDQHRPQCNSVS